jgi:heme-degrading monooxygenase HmoA
VQQWESMAKIQAWRSDPEFVALRKVGEQFAKFRSFAVEGTAQATN